MLIRQQRFALWISLACSAEAARSPSSSSGDVREVHFDDVVRYVDENGSVSDGSVNFTSCGQHGQPAPKGTKWYDVILGLGSPDGPEGPVKESPACDAASEGKFKFLYFNGVRKCCTADSELATIQMVCDYFRVVSFNDDTDRIATYKSGWSEACPGSFSNLRNAAPQLAIEEAER
eukprot:TRINITY_DN74869_c0_g1_i1.p1 TRINITY_DN74869_c0_g1~~TRINITY_DN74869_c0_g1_i1.p1  ORF type:complete len:176 (+),score=28.38 TRINITY_DN74869_c0_g1_i1:180-707(+)